ncbi:hypothetical protein OSB04_022862 [Centaurea solstitialis]|uniref:Potassium channel domain-containing protein n=1 Tax=Centaurea solstitialis TaxID=347529 RepID=A0AA38W8V5_9ASTR|nr:hypothetical protein OSB04_022862 [Centaurea solstitialis]
MDPGYLVDFVSRHTSDIFAAQATSFGTLGDSYANSYKIQGSLGNFINPPIIITNHLLSPSSKTSVFQLQPPIPLPRGNNNRPPITQMESDPFHPTRKTNNLDNYTPTSSNSSSSPQYQDSSSFNPSPPLFLLLNNNNSSFNANKHKFYRCKTAPAMVVMPEDTTTKSDPKPSEPDSGSLLRQALLLLILYLSLGVFIYYFNRDHFSGLETHPLVDALYFCIVTMCTIGYGDIAPITPSAKLFSCFFVLVGFGFIDIMLSGVVNYVLDLQENLVLKSIKLNKNLNQNHNHMGVSSEETKRFSPIDYIFDFAKGRMRIRLKVGLALGVVLLSIGMGTVVLFFVEGLNWIDSLYLSVLSVTTVGYGDKAFKTLPGRLFASVWLLFSTLMVARSFLYLTEARIDKRHRRLANRVLQRQITVKDLLAADINNNGFLCKSEYVVFKLKEMGKIKEREVLQICDQFNKLDSDNSGKITLRRLFAGRNI